LVTRNRVGAQAVDTVATTSNNNPQDPSKDNRVPSAPATLAATPPPVLVYNAGTYTSTVSLTWVLPTKAVDGSTMTPDHTEVYRLAGTGSGAFILVTTVDVPDHTAVLPGYGVGTVWQFKVRVVSANNKKSAFSNTLQLTMPVTAPQPPMPSPPETSSVGLLAQVSWDGKDQSGAAMPPDFDHITVKRADDTNFTTNVVQMGTLLNAGTHIDGPYDINDVYYYRFFAVNRMGVTGPDSVSSAVLIAGMDGSDIQPGTIDTLQLHDQLAADIQKAISSTESNAVPGNRIFGPSATPPTGSTSDPLLAGDLWFDSNNVPWRYGGSDTGPPNHGWVNVRDAVVDDAFKSVAGSVVLSQPYLLPDYVQTQFLKAKLVSADVLIAEQTITTDIIAGKGLFGTMNAAVLNAGTISADRIAANSITADKLLVADLTNFCNEPLFDNGGKSWIDPQSPLVTPGTHNAPVQLTVAASGGVPTLDADGVTTNYNDGWVYDAAGIGGAGYTIANTRTLDVTEIDQFYGELWVRRTTSATTGKVTLALNVTCGPNNTVTTQPIASYTFKTSDPVNKWFQITGFIQPLPPSKPAPDKLGGPGIIVFNAQSLPQGAFRAQPVILMDPTLIAGYKVQFTGARVQRKQHSQLVVDGSITASMIRGQSITAAEIGVGQITADNIKTNTITATEIFSSGITGTSASISFITALLIRGETISTVGWDTVNKRPLYPGVTIDKNAMVYNDKDGNDLFNLNFQNGSITFNSSAPVKNLARYEIDQSGIRLFPAGAGATPSVNLNTSNGSATFAGSVHSGGTITGANIRTSPSNPLIEMLTVGTGAASYDEFAMTTATGGVLVMFRTAVTSPAADAWIKLDTFPAQPTTSKAPRFLLDSNVGMIFYSDAKTIAFKLDGNTGAVTLAGPVVSGATITASTFQSAASGNPRLLMNASAFSMTDDQGNLAVRFLAGSTSVDGAILLDTGPDHYPRFTLNSASGMYWYNASKAITFSLTFADSAIKMTGPIITSGTITGAAVHTGATGARVWLDPTNGIRAWQSDGTYSFYATMQGNAYFSGNVDSATVTATTITGGTVNATHLNAVYINGTNNGTIGGGNYSSPGISNPGFSGSGGTNSGTITGGTWRSTSGPNRIEIVGNAMVIYSNNVVAGWVENYSSSDDVLIYGSSSSGAVWLGYGSGGGQFAVFNGGSGGGYVRAYAVSGTPITSIVGYAAVYASTSASNGYMGIYTSSVRYKKAVQPLALHPGFMEVQAATWADKPSRATVDVRIGNPGVARRNTGFTAENLHRAGLTDAVTYDAHRRPNGIQQPAVMAHTVAYVQHLVRQVQDLTARVAALEGAR
jgi:hypothetical protein